MTADEDAADVDRVRSGDREAFARLYDRHAARVRAVVAAVSADFASTEDLTQEAFLRAYRLLDRLRDTKKFGPWIGEIARRVGRERRRSLGRDRHEFVGDAAEGVSEADDPVDRAADREQTALLMRHVAGLPERERLALHAFYFHDQSADAAAATVGVSRSAFYALLGRARETLARRLAGNEAQA